MAHSPGSRTGVTLLYQGHMKLLLSIRWIIRIKIWFLRVNIAMFEDIL